MQRVMARRGITKGAGTMAVDYHEVTAEVVAEIGVMWRKQLKRNEKALRANGRRIAELAAAHQVPGTVDIERGLVNMDLQRFGVGLVDRQAPKRTNGHHHTDGVSPVPPPSWHPDHPEGGL
jgi:hypothetical protein